MATATTPKGIALTPWLTMLGAPDMIKKMKIVASERKLRRNRAFFFYFCLTLRSFELVLYGFGLCLVIVAAVYIINV